MTRYIVVRFGDNDFTEALRAACESFISAGGWHPLKDMDEHVLDIRVIEVWLESFFRCSCVLNNNRPDMLRWSETKLPDTSPLYAEYFNLKGTIAFEDSVPYSDNGEVVYIDTHTYRVDTV